MVLFVWAVGPGWVSAQTLAPIPGQNYFVGGTNPPIPLLTSGFQTGSVIRIMAANTTSGSGQSYQEAGTRIFQGLQPDIVMIQEFNVSNSTSVQIRGWVDTTFGPEFSYFRENYAGIPNGVISRWPILQSGSWDDGDNGITNRGFAWAQIDIPGVRNLWVVSVHFKASGSSTDVQRRTAQAQTLVSLLQANVPAEDYLLVGGDFNTSNYSEPCLEVLGSMVDVAAPRPTDEGGNPYTNRSRFAPYDWVMAEPELDLLEVPVTLGTLSFPSGLVFDSRVFSDLSLVPPVQMDDSNAFEMQHMAVVRSFQVEEPAILQFQVHSDNPSLLPEENIWLQEIGPERNLYLFPIWGEIGTANLTVTVSDGVYTDMQTFAVVVSAALTPLQSWALSYGLTAEEAFPEADLDGDGWTLAEEYAFGLTPDVPGGELVKLSPEGDKIHYLQRFGLNYTVWSATDLGAGFEGTVDPVRSEVQPENLPLNYEQWEAPMPSGSRGFLKVEAILPP